MLFDRLARLSRLRGIQKACFIMSFDCDTERDIEVVEAVHRKMMSLSIMPVYAVPGQLLERGRSVYSKIAATGAEFINHGYYEHSRLNPETGAYDSSFFYDKLDPETIIEDITRGHETHIRVLGKEPKGFRVPHFGTFQRRSQLSFLYAVLGKLGYTYSSSTLPLFGFLRGPVFKGGKGLYEIPVSGCFDYPLSVLDSWGFRYAPDRKVNEDDYLIQLERLLGFLGSGSAGLLNLYVDPSQVYDWNDFFLKISKAAPFATPSYMMFLKSILS